MSSAASDVYKRQAQLIDTQDNFHVWSDSYDRQLDNVFEIQSEIAEAIAGALRVPQVVDEKADLVIPTADMHANDLYLEGRARVRARGPENIMNAITLFEAAIARDSGWAPAWAGLAIARSLEPYYQLGNAWPASDAAVWEAALSAVERSGIRALELDPDNASARVALGTIYRDRWMWDAAEAEFRSALATDPDNVEAYQQYAEMLKAVGRQAEALNSSARALALDRSPIRLATHANVALSNGRVEEAINLALEGIEKDAEANVDLLDNVLFGAFLNSGRYDELQRLLASRGKTEGLKPAIAAVQAGDPGLLEPIDYAPFTAYALLLMEMPDRALDVLDGWVIDPPFMGKAELFAPEFDPIRDDPRVQAILAQMGLEGVEPVRAPLP